MLTLGIRMANMGPLINRLMSTGFSSKTNKGMFPLARSCEKGFEAKVCALPPGAWLRSVLLLLYVEIRPIVNTLNNILEMLVWYFSFLLAREQ